ncbi:unnamed protein product [Ectocarpus sp. CCAP 1310/34]|nr:unnamed protein product [Ectocarpus sp. CCAP 1310/34]
MLTESRLPSIMRTALAIRAYAVLEIEEGVNKMRHSRYVGDVVKTTAQTVRKWVKEFCQDGKFLISKRLYEIRQADSFIDPEDIAERCREEIDRRLYRRKKTDPWFRVSDFQRWVNTVLLKEVFSGGGGISRTTAHSWICRLGFRWKKSGKCVYVDGHNRPDVEARPEYVAKMLILRKMMSM